MSDSVGLIQESLSAAFCRNRRMRTQQVRGRPIIAIASTAFVSIRVIRGPSFSCPRITRMNANRNPLCGAPHSVQAGLPNSPFRIPNCTAFRPRNLRTDYKAGNPPVDNKHAVESLWESILSDIIALMCSMCSRR